MLFSQTVEYALRAAVALAMDPDLSRTTQELTEVIRAPSGYLAKVMQLLARSGIVHSQRGPSGGFRLSVPPGQLTILDIVNAVDPIRRIEKCPLNLPSHGVTLCPLHKRLDDAIASVERAFRETTLADLLNEPTHSRPLCDTTVELTASASH